MLKNFKTADISGTKIKPIFKKSNTKNTDDISRSPMPKNNISEIDLKETMNSQILQTSLTSIDNSINVKVFNKNQEDCNMDKLYKKYLISKTLYNKKISEITNINNKYNENNNEIEKLKKILENLKQEKKEKQANIVDLLSKKESLEEIYKLKLSSLLKKNKNENNNDTNEQTKENKNDTKNKSNRKNSTSNNNNNNNNEEIPDFNPFATIYILEDNKVEMKLDDIKISDQKKYEEQVINFYEELLHKKDNEIKNQLIEKIKFGYQIFFLETNSYTCIKLDNIISNFFSRASSIISKESNGKYSEKLINSFLKILLKLNNINDEMSEKLKFLNKTYKNQKKEIKEKINNLTKKNENLKTKKISYENIKNELKKFIDENKDKFKNNEKNQNISLMLNNNIRNDLEYLDDSKKSDMCETEIKKNNKSENNDTFENKIKIGQIKDLNITQRIKKGLNIKHKKINKNKFLNMSSNMSENYNGVKSLNNFIINYIPYDNKNKKITKTNEQNISQNNGEINVNNLLINNNIKIENNNNIINNNNKTDNKEKFYNVQNSPKHKNIVIPIDMKFNSLKKIKIPFNSNQKIFHSPTNLKRPNFKNKLFSIDSRNISNKSKNLTPSKNLNYNDTKTTTNNNTSNKSFNNNYINITKDIPKSFCYFKISSKGNSKFNPLNNGELNPTKFNYYEGDILIDKIFNKLKIIRKTEKKFIGIDLKDIVDINISKSMENVIKVYKIYINIKNEKKQENFDINQFVNSDEFKGIRMQQNEKVKAIRCKYFTLSIIIGKKFIPKAEFIFDNYDIFNIWFKCLDSIVKLNNSDKEKNKLSDKEKK